MAKILLVEDNEMNRDLISRRLKRRGFELVIAVDGGECLDKARSERPDLILMDMGLPVLDGYEATRRLKGDPATRSIPIVGLSAHAMSGDTERALAAGCDDYDTKPVDWKRLLGKIETLLEKAEQRLAAAMEERETQRFPLANPTGPAPSRVLVIDDSAMHRDVLGRRLGELSYAFEAVAGGEAALEALAAKAYDAVLLDVAMPGLGGDELLARMQEHPDWRRIPVLMLSTVDTMESAVDCLERGAEDFVPQPFHCKVLAARLAAVIERKRLREENAAAPPSAENDRRQGEYLLRAMLPDALVDELRTTSKILPRRIAQAAVLEVSVHGFAARCIDGGALEVVGELHALMLEIEGAAERHGLDLVRRGGTSATLVAGLFASIDEPALPTARAALELAEFCRRTRPGWEIRFGIDVGSVLTGAIGRRALQFGVWGEPVDGAAQTARGGEAGTVRVTWDSWEQIAVHAEGRAAGEGAWVLERLLEE